MGTSWRPSAITTFYSITHPRTREPEYQCGGRYITPFGAGCHSVCILAYREAEAEKPRAIIGLIDISAGKHVNKDILSFTVPYKMFLEMESNVEGSFLECEEWHQIRKRN